MRITRLLTGVVLGLAAPLWVQAAGAAASTTTPPASTLTTTTQVAATCTTTPLLTDPRTQEYTIVVTVPKRVAPGADATIHATVDYPVGPNGAAGAISVAAHQGDTTTQQFIGVGPGSPDIDGSATFAVTGRPGSDITWEIQYFGQTEIFGGVGVSEVCIPSTPVTVAGTRIDGGILARSPAPARLAPHLCATPRVPLPLAFLCRLAGLRSSSVPRRLPGSGPV